MRTLVSQRSRKGVNDNAIYLPLAWKYHNQTQIFIWSAWSLHLFVISGVGMWETHSRIWSHSNKGIVQFKFKLEMDDEAGNSSNGSWTRGEPNFTCFGKMLDYLLFLLKNAVLHRPGGKGASNVFLFVPEPWPTSVLLLAASSLLCKRFVDASSQVFLGGKSQAGFFSREGILYGSRSPTITKAQKGRMCSQIAALTHNPLSVAGKRLQTGISLCLFQVKAAPKPSKPMAGGKKNPLCWLIPLESCNCEGFLFCTAQTGVRLLSMDLTTISALGYCVAEVGCSWWPELKRKNCRHGTDWQSSQLRILFLTH